MLLTDEVVPDPGEPDTVLEVVVSEHLPATSVPPRVHHLGVALPILPPHYLDHSLRETLG